MKRILMKNIYKIVIAHSSREGRRGQDGKKRRVHGCTSPSLMSALSRFYKYFLIILLSFGLISCANTPDSLNSKSQVAYGKSLFEQGYYRQAMKQLLPMACDGNADAEYAVGYMYYYGYGVPQDTDVGAMWIRRAACHHNCQAMMALPMVDKASPPPPQLSCPSKSKI